MVIQIIIIDVGCVVFVVVGNGGMNVYQVVEIGLVNVLFVVDKGFIKLLNELKWIKFFGGVNVVLDMIYMMLKDDLIDQYLLYGFGFYFDNGVLLVVYGQVMLIMEKLLVVLLLLLFDMQFVMIDVMQFVFGDVLFLNLLVIIEWQGVVELVMQGEVDVGSDDMCVIMLKMVVL